MEYLAAENGSLAYPLGCQRCEQWLQALPDEATQSLAHGWIRHWRQAGAFQVMQHLRGVLPILHLCT